MRLNNNLGCLPFVTDQHPYGQGVDFKVMNTFTEFYVYLLGFVNFRLYHQLSIHYPPKLAAASETDTKKEGYKFGVDDRLAGLNCQLKRDQSGNDEDEDVKLDEINVVRCRGLLSFIGSGQLLPQTIDVKTGKKLARYEVTLVPLDRS